jgi:hypothetical protein
MIVVAAFEPPAVVADLDNIAVLDLKTRATCRANAQIR